MISGMPLRNLGIMAVSLVDVKNLRNEWEIQCLILLSFALQVFLFVAAGVRRRSSSRVVGVLVWLAYLSADSVAIYVLGHLAVNAGGPNHQLVFLWAPFVLLHLGGQDTITAFSMQDNELWRRHLLTFAQQLALAIYDVSKTPWPDRRLLATVALMFLSGCVKYAERTTCLATARPERLMHDFLGGFKDRVTSIREMQNIARFGGLGMSRYLSSSAFSKFSLNPAMDVMSTDIPPNYDWSVSRDIFADLYYKISQLDFPDQEDYFRQMYRFAEEKLFVCYQRLYTKAIFRLSPLGALLHLVTFLSTSAALVLFHFSVSGGQARKVYGAADVVVTYVLLVGAVTLEACSFVLSMLTRQNLWSHPMLCSCVRYRPIIEVTFFLTCGNCAVMLRRWRPPRHWSRMLPQYSIIGRSAQKHASGRSLLPRCIAERVKVGTKPVQVTNSLKQFIIRKLLDPDAVHTDSDFTGSRGEVALSKWLPAAGTVLRESIEDVDFPTSVLLWHIATDVCFFSSAEARLRDPADEEKKTISRQLSNYVMYLVFKCGVTRTSGAQFLLRKAEDEVLRRITRHAGKSSDQAGQQQQGKKDDEHEAMERLLRSGLLERSLQDLAAADAAAAAQVTHSSAIEVLSDKFLPRAFKLAAALGTIRDRRGHHQATAGSPWDLIAAVWLEMLYYIAARCGAAFHRQHLSTGGELVTHVLVLMYTVGPLGYHPDMLQRMSDRGANVL